MAENYDLIFGQSASQQYAWSDSDYQNGWQTVGSTPPTAEQFDALQRRSDTKAQDLNNRLAPIEEKSEADGRQAATSYTAGAMVTVDGLPNGWLLQCIVPGTSGTDTITLPDTLIDGLTIIDGDVTWALRKVATNGGLGYRQPNTTYTAGQIAYHASLPTGWYLECTTAGISGSGELSISSPSIGDTVSDGTAVWTVMKNLPLSGGDMVGADVIIGKVDADGALRVRAGTNNGDSGELSLFGKNSSSVDAGGFMLSCGKSASGTYRYLIGLPDGSLSWGNGAGETDLAGSAIVAKSLGSNGYIKYASGLTVQWGESSLENANGVKKFFPIAFTSRNHQVFAGIRDVGAGNDSATMHVLNLGELDGFKIYSTLNSSKYNYSWFAIGY